MKTYDVELVNKTTKEESGTVVRAADRGAAWKRAETLYGSFGERVKSVRERGKLCRVKFYTSSKNGKPSKWPPKYPYWYFGKCCDGLKAVNVTYAETESYIQYIKDYWPDASDIVKGAETEINPPYGCTMPEWWQK